MCGHHCAFNKGGASRVDGVPWNWPGRAAAERLDGLQSTSAGHRLRACRAMPASQASSRTTPACLWAVAVPPSTGHELGTLHPRAVGWCVAVQGGRSTSVVVVSLDEEAVQCSTRGHVVK